MLCLRCRALPSIRASGSSIRAPMNRLSQFTSQPTASRQFSSLLSSPALRQPTQMQTSFSKLQTTPTISTSITSLLAQSQLSQASSQGQGQTRAFSASASLGVRRVTFRPSRLVQKRRHGFLARNKSKKGRQTLTRRRVKGRRNMSW